MIVVDLLHSEEYASQIAEFVRASWPEAKLLVLGQSCGHLDDWLYDDVVDPCCNPEGLIQSAQHLLEWARPDADLPRNRISNKKELSRQGS